MNTSCVGTWVFFSHFIIYFCFHITLCISAIVSPLAFHMPCCINISIPVFFLSLWMIVTTNHFISDFTSHYSFSRPSLWIWVFMLHHTLGGFLPVKHWFFTTCYGFFFLYFIMHLIFHNSFCIFPTASHDSLHNFASYSILPLWCISGFAYDYSFRFCISWLITIFQLTIHFWCQILLRVFLFTSHYPLFWFCISIWMLFYISFPVSSFGFCCACSFLFHCLVLLQHLIMYS